METKYPNFLVRLLALGIDVAVVWLPVFVFSRIFPAQLRALGPFGRLVGLGVALAYFGFLNSKWGGGQSYGKRWTRIKVTDREGDLLSLPRSLIRYLILILPVQLIGTSGLVPSELVPRELLPSGLLSSELLPSGLFPRELFPSGSEVEPIVSIIIGWVLVAALLGAPLFYLMNGPSRRCPHDILTGTAVVEELGSQAYAKGIPRKPTFLLVGVLCLLLALRLGWENTSKLGALNNVVAAVEDVPSVWNVTVGREQERPFWTSRERRQSPCLSVTVRSSRPDVEAKKIAASVAGRVASTGELARGEALKVNVTSGYDLGFLHSLSTEHFHFDPRSSREPASTEPSNAPAFPR